MLKHAVRYSLLIIVTLLLTGCVVANQITEKQAEKAFLKKDYDAAFAKYTSAAKDGSANAQYFLGTMYLEGEGVDKDVNKALELLNQASEQEQKDALLMLGLFYVYGDHVEKDPKKGADLIYRAGLARNDVAMYYMGHLYAAGLGVDKDIRHAQMWMYNAKRFDFPVPPELLTKQGLEDLYDN